MEKNKLSFGKILGIALIVYILFAIIGKVGNKDDDNKKETVYSDSVFSIISNQENKGLEETIEKFARKNAIDINITYAGDLDIIARNTMDCICYKGCTHVILANRGHWLLICLTPSFYQHNNKTHSGIYEYLYLQCILIHRLERQS